MPALRHVCDMRPALLRSKQFPSLRASSTAPLLLARRVRSGASRPHHQAFYATTSRGKRKPKRRARTGKVSTGPKWSTLYIHVSDYQKIFRGLFLFLEKNRNRSWQALTSPTWVAAALTKDVNSAALAENFGFDVLANIAVALLKANPSLWVSDDGQTSSNVHAAHTEHDASPAANPNENAPSTDILRQEAREFEVMNGAEDADFSARMSELYSTMPATSLQGDIDGTANSDSDHTTVTITRNRGSTEAPFSAAGSNDAIHAGVPIAEALGKDADADFDSLIETDTAGRKFPDYLVFRRKAVKLFPTFLPYRVQYTISVEVQTVLEESLHWFVQKWKPEEIRDHERHFPEAIEFMVWVRRIPALLKKLPADASSPGSIDKVPALLRQLVMLRHRTVHRDVLSDDVLLSGMRRAMALTLALKDSTRYVHLSRLYSVLRKHLRVRQKEKTDLERRNEENNSRISARFEVLNRRRVRLGDNILKEDATNEIEHATQIAEATAQIIHSHRSKTVTDGIAANIISRLKLGS